MSTIGTAVTETRNIRIIKGEYREISFTVPYLYYNGTAFSESSITNWALYVRPEENGVIVAQTSKTTEEDNVRTEWYVSGQEVTVKFFPDFSDDQALGSPSYYYDVILDRSDGLRGVPIRGTMQFIPRYTRDDDTEAQILARETDWTTDFCTALADQRTALLGIPETGSYVGTPAGAEDDTTITIALGASLSFGIGDDIGIELDSPGGTYHETTVSSVEAANEFGLTAPLPGAASTNNGVYKGKCNHVRCGT